MVNRPFRGPLRRAALMMICAGAGACAVPAVAGAATTITPASFTSCWGGLKPDPGAKKADEPGLLDYSFKCNGGIFAYTIVAHQAGDRNAAIQDYSSSPLVYETAQLPSPTETVTCEGSQPSNGINCNTGTYLSEVSGGYSVDGSIELGQGYCKHFPTPAKGKALRPGTKAVGTALVQLIVTDWSGAEDGPFALRLSSKCPAVPNRVPEPVKTKSSTRSPSRRSAGSEKHTTHRSTSSAR